MPFNYRRRRKRRPRYKRKKRTFRRRRRRRKMKVSIRRLGKTSTDALMVKLNWQTQFFIDDTPLPAVSLRMNSVFDPSTTGTSLQPTGFDQWKQFYSKYQVMGSRITVIAINNSTDRAFNFAVYPSNDETRLATYSQCALTKYATNRYVSPSSGGNPRVVVSKYMTPSKIFGRSVSDTLFAADIDEDPELECFWHIKGTDTFVTHTNVDLQWQVRLMYYVKFFNRIEVTEIVPPP